MENALRQIIGVAAIEKGLDTNRGVTLIEEAGGQGRERWGRLGKETGRVGGVLREEGEGKPKYEEGTKEEEQISTKN